MLCTIEDCEREQYAKGMCDLHYKRVLRTGSPFVSRPCLRGTIEEKWNRYVDKKSKDECWEWKGYKDKDGYGKMRVEKTNKGAHIVSFYIHNGYIWPEKLILHSCNNPSCVNPNHLREGTQVENMKDRTNSGNAPSGEKHPNCKYSDKVVKEILNSEESVSFLNKKYGMSKSQIRNIKAGRQRGFK